MVLPSREAHVLRCTQGELSKYTANCGDGHDLYGPHSSDIPCRVRRSDMKKRVYFLMIFLLATSSDRLFAEKRRVHPVSGVLYQHLRHEAGGRELHARRAAASPREVTEELSRKNGPSPGGKRPAAKALPDEVRVEHWCPESPGGRCWTSTRPTTIWTRFGRFSVRAAFVDTLIQVSNVEQVVITVNGEDLVDEAGDVVGGMTAESFIDTKGDGSQFLPEWHPVPLISRTATAVSSSSGRCENVHLFFQFHAGKGDPGGARSKDR